MHLRIGASLGEVTHSLIRLSFYYLSFYYLSYPSGSILLQSILWFHHLQGEDFTASQISLFQCLITFLTLQLGTSLVFLGSFFGLIWVKASADFSCLNIGVWSHLKCQDCQLRQTPSQGCLGSRNGDSWNYVEAQAKKIFLVETSMLPVELTASQPFQAQQGSNLLPLPAGLCCPRLQVKLSWGSVPGELDKGWREGRCCQSIMVGIGRVALILAFQPVETLVHYERNIV